MRRIAATFKSLFDIRPGEYGRTIFMALYLLCVLFSYYILKSASEAMFLNKFDIDKLPNLYILMAIFGGGLAFVYSKAAAKTSLNAAVTWTLGLSVLCLIGMWFPLRGRNETIVYVFAVWVRLFSVVAVTQGWLVASNLFNAREAKRVYGLLGMGMVVGAVAGGEFTARTVRLLGTDNLLFASAGLVVLAYGCYLGAVTRKGVSLGAAKGAGEEEADFSFKDVANDIGRNRHLQALVLIMTMQFIVDTLIDYQFKAMAKQAYKGAELTAFFGRFYGRYLNLTELVIQLFFTTAIVRRLGVGGTMQVMPVSLAAASLFTFASPSVISASLARLVEASTRYTLARTGNELFYMPLPVELRNRIKAFIDIFVDRAARGVCGLLLILFAKLAIPVSGIALITIVVTAPWILLTVRAHREYVRTIRRRLEARRLDIESARITVEDADTVRLLEATAAGSNARQAAYALSLLDQAPGYDLEAMLRRSSGSEHTEVRSRVFALAAARKLEGFHERALSEIRSKPVGGAARQAAIYLLTVSDDRRAVAAELLEHPDPTVQEGVIEALASQPEAAAEIVSHQWITKAARDPDPRRRILAARMLGVCGDQGTEAIHWMLADPDAQVAAAACRAAGMLRNRAYILAVVQHLANPRTRGAAIESLAHYGPAICGTMGDILEDEKIDIAVRSNVPRVLKLIPHQRSVDVLLAASRRDEPAIRRAALKGLNRLRETAPSLDYSDAFLTQRILNEAHHYFELNAAAAVLRNRGDSGRTAVSLLARTLDERVRQALERVFRLLGLRYPSREMYWAFQALSRPDRDRRANAVEFLDNLLGQDLKRVLLPMLESQDRVLENGRALFGVQVQDEETTLRALVHSDDSWLVVCAMAAAAELKLRGLAADIAGVASGAGDEVREVARSAEAVLA